MPPPEAKAPPDQPRGRACQLCMHYGSQGPNIVCKCYPPVWNGTSWVWPTVSPQDWCGQYAGPSTPIVS